MLGMCLIDDDVYISMKNLNQFAKMHKMNTRDKSVQ